MTRADTFIEKGSLICSSNSGIVTLSADESIALKAHDAIPGRTVEVAHIKTARGDTQKAILAKALSFFSPIGT